MKPVPFPFIPLSGVTVAGNEAHGAVTLGAGVFELNVPMGANCIIIQATAQNIRYTLTGTNPTAGLGFQLVAAAEPAIYALNEHVVLKFFREASGAILQYEFGHNPVI